jgi:hypothetical protein
MKPSPSWEANKQELLSHGVSYREIVPFVLIFLDVNIVICAHVCSMIFVPEAVTSGSETVRPSHFAQ